MIRRGLIHVHSAHSFDSLLPVSAYLAYARAKRLDFLALTDHNSIAGSLELARRNRHPGLTIIVGAEYATDRGDVIGLFLEREIRDRRWERVIAEIRAQAGLVLIPHPYRHSRLEDDALQEADLIETFNARTSRPANEAAADAAQRLGIPATVGSDSHTAWELVRGGTTITLHGGGDLRQALLSAPRVLSGRSSGRNLTRYSRVVKAARARAGLARRA